MDILIDLMFELKYAFQRKKLGAKPTLLALSVDRFTNSTWLEDLHHFKSIDQYLCLGKGSAD
jgi:hypothetical protein